MDRNCNTVNSPLRSLLISPVGTVHVNPVQYVAVQMFTKPTPVPDPLQARRKVFAIGAAN